MSRCYVPRAMILIFAGFVDWPLAEDEMGKPIADEERFVTSSFAPLGVSVTAEVLKPPD